MRSVLVFALAVLTARQSVAECNRARSRAIRQVLDQVNDTRAG